MSTFKNKYKFWVATKQQLENVIVKQKILEKITATDDRFQAHCIHADMCCDYIDLVNKLGYIYHRTFQVQKRQLLTRLLEAASTRLIELRNELKDIELNEFIYIDRTLIQRKLNYDIIHLIRPDFVPFLRDQEINNLIKNPQPKPDRPINEEQNKKVQLASSQMVVPMEKILTEKEKRIRDAVILIQSHERLRVKRIWKTNIMYDPKKYLPTAELSDSKEQYIFTYKPDQKMLIPLKKTKFGGKNCYKKINEKIHDSFEFYTKPGTAINPAAIIQNLVQSVTEQIEKNEGKFEKEYTRSSLNQIKQRAPLVDSIEELEVIERTAPDTGEQIKNNAARKIQKAWIEFLTKRAYHKQLEKNAIFYGAASEHKTIKNPLDELFKQSYELKTIKDQYFADFIKATENEQNRIIINHSSGIMEDISDHIRYWIRNFYDTTNNLPPFPSAAKGGTILVLQENVIEPREFNLNKTKTRAKLAAESKKIKDNLIKEKKKSKDKAMKQAKMEKFFRNKIAKDGKIYYDFEKIFKRNKSTKILEQGLNEIKDKWHYDVDEELNVQEAPFMTWIREDKFAEVHMELRKIMDNIMRLEYEKLRRAIAIDKNRKYKQRKIPKTKIVKKRIKIIKKEIDLTADMTTQEIFYKMQDTGLIRNYKKRCFEEFFGDFNYCAFEFKNFFKLDVQPSTLEIRTILRESILGMGSLNNIPKHKSILIGGPPKSGKMMLCEILASEIDAVMIDLSIEIVSKYQNDIDMLLHLVNKMSRILQPTIIFIENIHRTFWKKIPTEYQYLNPRVLSKYIKNKIFKSIKNNEKILILATTDEPWKGSRKMNNLFEKIILMPKTDYSTAYMLWKKLILQNHGVPRNLEFSSIALVCRDYTSGQISENINKTLNVERRMKLLRNPLKFEEFVETFIDMNSYPALEDSYYKYYKWYTKANKLAKKRIKVMKILKPNNRK